MPKLPKPTISDAKMAKVMRWIRDHPGRKRRDVIENTGITLSEWIAATRNSPKRRRLISYQCYPTGWYCPAGTVASEAEYGFGGLAYVHGNHHWNEDFVARCTAFLAANPPEEA